MTKTDLRTGMIATQRNGNRVIILRECKFYEPLPIDSDNVYVRLNGDTWDGLQYLNDDLTGINYREYDIVKIEIPRHPYDIFKKDGKYKTVWEREEITPYKEMTIEEIQKELGYKIKVVENKK